MDSLAQHHRCVPYQPQMQFGDPDHESSYRALKERPIHRDLNTGRAFSTLVRACNIKIQNFILADTERAVGTLPSRATGMAWCYLRSRMRRVTCRPKPGNHK
jgi:hypothetical protein